MTEKRRFGPQPEWRAGCAPERPFDVAHMEIRTKHEPFFSAVGNHRESLPGASPSELSQLVEAQHKPCVCGETDPQMCQRCEAYRLAMHIVDVAEKLNKQNVALAQNRPPPTMLYRENMDPLARELDEAFQELYRRQQPDTAAGDRTAVPHDQRSPEPTLSPGKDGLPPVDTSAHTPEIIASLQRPAMQLDDPVSPGKVEGWREAIEAAARCAEQEVDTYYEGMSAIDVRLSNRRGPKWHDGRAIAKAIRELPAPHSRG